MRFLIFLVSFLFAGNLINVNFFPHKKFIDILISLDDKFNGKVTKIDKNSYFISNVFSTKVYEKSFENEYIKKVVIAPYENGIKFEIFPKRELKTSIALTPEGYGLRFRLSFPIKNEIKPLMQNKEVEKLDYTTYMILIAILIVLGIILFLLKRRVKKLPALQIDAKIVFQKPIDAKNKVVLVEFHKRKYLLVIGTTNLLLDIFDEEMIRVTTQKEFDEFLELNNKMDEIKKYIKHAEELKEIDERV